MLEAPNIITIEDGIPIFIYSRFPSSQATKACGKNGTSLKV
jgi:hypothetical protein